MAKPARGPLAKPAGAYRHGNLRAALIACALQILEREGVARLTLRAAARLARVAPSAPAHHFRDKNGLLAAVATEGWQELIRRRQTVRADAADPESRLRRMLAGYVDFAIERPALFQLMFGPFISNYPAHPELLETSRACFDLLEQAVADYLRERGAVVAEPAAVVTWISVHGLAALLTSLPMGPLGLRPVPADALKQELVDVLLTGITARYRSPRTERGR